MYRDEDDPFDERGLLKDGHVARVRMTLRDGKPMREFARPRITDAFGRPPGNRPGFLVSDHGREAKQQAYLDYENWVGSRWRDQDDPNGAGSSGPIGQREGDACTINGFAGRLRRDEDGKLVCVANKQSFNGSNGDEDEPEPDDPVLAQSDRRSISDIQKAHAQNMARLIAARDAADANAWRKR
jgi:hypothetical protein